MRRTTTLTSAAVLGLALGIVLSTPAQAVDVPGGFTADDLPTWQTNGTVRALTPSAAGLVVAGGSFTALRPPGTSEGDPASVQRSGLAVLDAATGSPTTCAPAVRNGSQPGTVHAAVTAPDGRTVYIGGSFSSVAGVSRGNVAAIDLPTCTVVGSFTASASGPVYALTATDSRVYLGGLFTTVNGQLRPRLAAVTTASGAVLAFSPAPAEEVLALNVDPANGNVLVGGRFSEIDGQESHALAVLDTDGALVRGYPKGFIPWSAGTGQRNGTSVIKSIAVDQDGFYVGAEGTGGGVWDGRAAFDWGTYQQRWRDGCLGANQAVVPYKGILYAASHGHDCSSENVFEDGQRHYFSAQSTTDKKWINWSPDGNDGIGEGIGPRAMTIATKGGKDYLWTGGEFTSINSSPQRGLTRFTTDPDVTAPTIPGAAVVQSYSPTANVVSWRSSVDKDDSTMLYDVYRNNGATPIGTVSGTSTYWDRTQLQYVDTSVVPGQSYSYRVTARDESGNVSSKSGARSGTVSTVASPYASQVVADGARIYLRGDESSGVYAASLGSGNRGGYYSGTVGRDAPGATEDGSTAVTFTGENTSFLHTESRETGPTQYTVEAWVNTTTTRGGKIIGFGNRAWTNNHNGTSSSYDRHVYLRNDGRVVFGVWTGSATTLTSPTAINDGSWHHVVASQGPGGMKLYVDGVRVGRNTNSTAQAYTGFWRIGGDSLSGWPNRPSSDFLAGTVDEVAIYDAPLTPQQVAAHYTATGRTVVGAMPVPTDAYGAEVHGDGPDAYWRLGEQSGSLAYDSSGNLETAGVTGAVTWGAPGAVLGTPDTAASFAGSAGAGVASTSSTASPSRWTSEVWFRTTSTTGGKLIGFGSSQTGSSSNHDKHLYMTNDGRLVAGVYTGSTQVAASTAAYNDGAWHHAVVTQGESGLQLYVDGAVVAGNPVTTNQAYAGFWRLGGDTVSGWPSAPTSGWFAGDLDEAAVYSRALTATEVASHWALGSGNTAPDTTPPSAVGDLTATADGTSVDLTWTAATDDTAVTAYDVHRTAGPGDPISAATLVATVTATSWTDTGLAPGTHHYQVVARDAAGNTGPAAAASADVPVPGGDAVTVTLTPASDTYSNQGAPGTAYGTSTSLASRGSLNYTSYLAFDLPPAPPGLALVGAHLQVRTTTASYAGSLDEHQVSAITAAWVEGTLTHNARPAVGPTIGTFTGATELSSAYLSSDLSAGLAPFLGAPATLTVSSLGADNLWFYSVNAGNATFRPTLTLQFA